MAYEHIFDELEISTDPFAVCELRGACDLGLERGTSATLHYILVGEGEIRLRSMAPLRVSRGTLVLVPALQSHALHSFGATGDPIPDCKPAALSLARLMATNDSNGDGGLVALCARVEVGLRGVAGVIDLIREPLVESVLSSNSIQPALHSLLHEVSNPNIGSRAMIRALLTQCMIEMLRKRLVTNDGSSHWMAALADPSVWNALRAMLEKPGDNHSVESLAEHVSMSRATFAKRFAEAYGAGPMELLRDLRMRRASTLLRDTNLPIKRIAEMVGFTSRSAFSRAFEAKTGQPPRSFRTSVLKS